MGMTSTVRGRVALGSLLGATERMFIRTAYVRFAERRTPLATSPGPGTRLE